MRLERLQTGSAFTPVGGWAISARAEIDEHLDALLRQSRSSRVNEAMRYAVLGSGKRIRPLLALAVADFIGGRPEGLMHVACAIEMVHAASLILDDLPCMDNDRLRRNRPSTHAAFGEDCAILAAVSLLMHGHSMLCAHPALAPEIRLAMIRLLCETVGADGLSLGQYIDLASKATQVQAEADAVAGVHHLKTGILFLAAARAACLLCGATPEQERKIIAFTTALGYAFQLKDDLSDQGEPGLNLVSAIGAQGVERKYLAQLRAAQEAIEGEANAEVLLGFMSGMFGR